MMTYKRKYRLIILAILSASTLAFTGCQSVSEETCLAGNWEAVGFKDGANGRSEKRLAKVAEKCGKFGAIVDNQTYWDGYNAGLTKYCTFQRGFERGENGGSYNQVCSGELAEEYAPGYEEGRVVYEIHREHAQLVARYDDRAGHLFDVRQRLKTEEMTDDERRRLKKKVRRLVREMDDARYNLRAFEREYGLPRRSLNPGH